jgi:hypothetical protein
MVERISVQTPQLDCPASEYIDWAVFVGGRGTGGASRTVRCRTIALCGQVLDFSSLLHILPLHPILGPRSLVQTDVRCTFWRPFYDYPRVVSPNLSPPQ